MAFSTNFLQTNLFPHITNILIIIYNIMLEVAQLFPNTGSQFLPSFAPDFRLPQTEKANLTNDKLICYTVSEVWWMDAR